MINKFKLLLLSSLCLVSLTNCATIMHGTTQSIGISSNPSDADVWVDNQFVGSTPMIVNMSRKNNHIVTIALEGYHPYEAVFSKQLSGWVFGNVVFGGIIGLAVDVISGGIYRLTPEQVQAEMHSKNIAYSKNSQESYIAIVLRPDPSWQKVGNLTAIN